MKVKLVSIVALLAAGSSPVHGVTVGYWRWEAGPANTDVAHTLPDGQFEGTIPDVSGNGNNLSAWSQGGCCGYQYRTDAPYAVVPQTGAADNFSVKNTGGGPGMFTDSAASAPWA